MNKSTAVNYPHMNKKGVAFPLEKLAQWILILVALILLIWGLALSVFPKFSQNLPKLFG